jgi:hypothetical protein
VHVILDNELTISYLGGELRTIAVEGNRERAVVISSIYNVRPRVRLERAQMKSKSLTPVKKQLMP